MHRHIKTTAMAAACALLLAACGGSSHDDPAPQPQPQPQPQPPVVVTPPEPVVTKLELLSSSARAMDSVAFYGGAAYVSLANSKTEGSAVLRATLPLTTASSWSPVGMGSCAMAPQGDFIMRSPRIKMVGENMWLMQPWYDAPDTMNEPSTCTLLASSASFIPRDQDLKVCNEYYCETLSMQDIKLHNGRLYSNAGGGSNLLTSKDNGATWQVVRGSKESMMCYSSKFHFIGERVFVGGECPLDMAFVEAYQLNADGSKLASEEKLPMTLPEMENRNVQFIDSVPGTQQVFIGVEGGLMRSEDNGRTFKFVIHEPLTDAKGYPYIGAFLALKDKPSTLVIGGFDKMHGRPYLAWSKDGGSTWTDISTMVPGYANKIDDENGVGSVSALMQDPQGRIIVVVNERSNSQGRLMQLTLGDK
jgi:hypothetical protein